MSLEFFIMERYFNISTFLCRCIFIPDNGAFFVNYVITSAFIGMAAELVRIPELLLYALKLAFARSAAERTMVRKVCTWSERWGCTPQRYQPVFRLKCID